jgi:hypothetical protein
VKEKRGDLKFGGKVRKYQQRGRKELNQADSFVEGGGKKEESIYGKKIASSYSLSLSRLFL